MITFYFQVVVFVLSLMIYMGITVVLPLVIFSLIFLNKLDNEFLFCLFIILFVILVWFPLLFILVDKFEPLINTVFPFLKDMK